VSFQFLATGMGHDDEGTEKGRVGSKILLKNDRYECDKGKETRVGYSRVLQTRVCPVL
jgi:hypothetical protein